MNACKSLVIFTVKPLLLALVRINLGISCCHLVVSLEYKPDDVLVVVVRCHMKEGRVLIIYQLVYFGKEMFEELLGFLVVKTLNCFEEFFFIDLSHL